MSSRSVLRRTAPYLLLAAMTLALMMPALRAAPMRYDSFWIDLVWSEQFTAALRAGVPYPRWLPLSFDGLGAPVFYFYAPLSFHLTGLFGLLGLATWPALLAGFAAAWFASGVTMLGWLRMQPFPSRRSRRGAAIGWLRCGPIRMCPSSSCPPPAASARS